MFFDSARDLLRVIAVGLLAYGGCVFLLRISGNRTLSKMNSFDLIVTVALGSTLSSILLTRSISLSEGWLALALLIGLQFAITWLSVRSGSISALVKTQPTLLMRDGRMIEDAMRKVRVTQDEMRAAVRRQGIGGMEQVAAAILETDGSLSIVPRSGMGSGSALERVAGATEQADGGA
ncbi:DUF421 domain-containing protein [Noviherbaspirillum pedocola]|uniref:DUF421 domain-containing protein n=1 Tax=Noviherbaspirillum pedocola TaxID=2801341 RepID=A0A934SWA7_9BURK|nr:YetF domain-containing protein [Noviherbaspirillum pedocola]MBK4736565.1 DUF421 domain-containing protein [Noviherbaspirillum pedocola]